jgi:hypothetical protein
MKNTLPKDFDPAIYLTLNPDVRDHGVDPSQHYLEHGIKENRKYIISEKSLEGHLTAYSADEPIELNAFKIFEASWSTAYNNDQGEPLTKGQFNGTNDDRIKWLSQKIKLSGSRVLELGPLEAAHTLMLENEGADVLSIEANVGAFLRCLVVKNQFNLKSKFLLGNFNNLSPEKRKFDLVLASGVLYHMSNPVEFLEKFSHFSEKIFLWTHYFDFDLSKWNPILKEQLNNGKWNYKTPEIVNYSGLDVKIVRQQYGDSLGWSGFCGGPEEYSYWIEKNDLISLLKKLGYSKIEVSFDDIAHQNGPSFCVLAQK